jgi:hypothetical protein
VLNKKFDAGGGFRNWHQESPSNFDSPRWPLLVHSLRHLQQFSLVDLLEHSGTPIKNVDLSALPRNLKSLQLSFLGAIAAFASTISKHPSHFEELESLEISGVERNRAYGTTRNKERMDLTRLIFDTLEHIVWPSTLQHLLIGQPGEVFSMMDPTRWISTPQSLYQCVSPSDCSLYVFVWVIFASTGQKRAHCLLV